MYDKRLCQLESRPGAVDQTEKLIFTGLFPISFIKSIDSAMFIRCLLVTDTAEIQEFYTHIHTNTHTHRLVVKEIKSRERDNNHRGV